MRHSGLSESRAEARLAGRKPITEDIRDHDLLGPAITRAQRNLVIRQMEKRFGSVPEWARQRLAAMSWHEVEETGLSLLDAHNLEDLFAK